MPISVDVLEKSLSQTTGFFKGPDLFKKWAKMAFILFVFALFTGGGLGGGGGSFDTGNLPSLGDTGSGSGVSTVSFLGQEDPLSNLTGFATLPTDLNFESLLPIILVLIIVVLIVVFILRIIGNAALFAALNSIETNIVRIGAIKENLSKGFSLAGLEFILGLLFLPFAIMLGLAIIGLFFNLFLGAIGNSPVIENLMSQIPFINDSGTLLIFGVIGFIGVIIFGIIGYFLDQFGVYLMYKKNIGSFTALREGISLGLGNFVELYLDGTFFGRTDEKYENYGGHVTLLEGRIIGLSITPKENKQHGYLRETKQEVVEVSSDLVRKYIIFN